MYCDGVQIGNSLQYFHGGRVTRIHLDGPHLILGENSIDAKDADQSKPLCQAITDSAEIRGDVGGQIERSQGA